MKKIICLLLLLSVPSAAGAIYFPDITDEQVKSSANVLSELGIMYGGSDGKFFPNDLLKRSEIATIAVRVAGVQSQLVEGEASLFKDVAVNHWAVPYINLANKNGLLRGDGTGYRPNDNLNISEICTILLRLLDKENLAVEEGGYPNGYLKVSRDIGLIGEEFTKNPSRHVTRGEIAIMICNALGVEL